MFKAYIFDWDNTLVDSLSVIRGAVSDTLDAFPYNGDREEIIASAGVSLSLREGFPYVFGENWEKAGKCFYKAYAHRIPSMQKMQGYDDLMMFLKANSLPCGVNSNKKHNLLEQELNHFDTLGVFCTAVGAGMMTHDKPEPDGALQIIAHLKEKFSVETNICYVGDSATDIKCGRSAGVRTVLIGDDVEAVAENPDYHFTTLAEFLTVISV